jgi:hypothetical protein
VKMTRNPHKRLSSNVQGEATLLTDEELIQVCHNSRAGEHLEVKRTEDLIQRRHNISDLRDRITEYIVRCNSCHRNKIQRDKRYDRVTQLDTLNAPWESVTMNFITKLPTSKDPAWGVKFDSILTIVDRLTKYTMFISFKKPQQHQYWCTPYCKNWLTITGYQRVYHRQRQAVHKQVLRNAHSRTRNKS